MCGILAALNLERPFDETEKTLLSKGLELISYRGPDARNYQYLSVGSKVSEKSNLFLGHNRLSIIDLSSDGTQPFTNDDKHTLVFNGEIYNYIELRKELQAKGHHFKTKTDTEVILNLYKEYGAAGFGRMNGMWAIVLYDSIKQKIILSRDRFSIKPLYYAKINGTIIFASEIKQITLFSSKNKINQNVLGNYLHSYLVDYSEETFFDNIYRIPASHNMTIDCLSGKEVLNKYWSFSKEDLSKRKSKELFEEWRALFTDAVKIRLRSDVKVGNTLSGGLDSSSIAIVADEVSEKPLTNISVVTDSKKHSEEQFVDILAERNSVNVQKIKIDNTNPRDLLEKVIWHNDEPILSLSTVAHFRMMQKFKEDTDITVILSGQGGDESLAGYNKYFFYEIKEQLREKNLFTATKSGFHLLSKVGNEVNLKYAKRYLGKSFQPKSIIESTTTFDYENAFLNTSANFRERQLLDINRFSVPALTHYEDRSSMHRSLEIRLPFLDHRLVNFNINLPLNLKISNGYSKYILRKSIPELPKEIAWRKDKKGFNTDEDIFYTPQNVIWIKSLFKNSVLAELGLLNRNLFIKEFDLFINKKSSYWGRDINRIIFAEIWAKTFILD